MFWQLARQLLHVEHPNSEEIVARQEQLNKRWGDLRDQSEAKREELQATHDLVTFMIEITETITWIEDKKRTLEQTDELKMDLTGITTLQRKLSGMERDLQAIEAKLKSLEGEAGRLQKVHPEEAEVIAERLAKVDQSYSGKESGLKEMVRVRDAKLEEAGDLHRFLKDLDHFQAWLRKTESSIANEDSPASLAEAEKLLSQHQQIRYIFSAFDSLQVVFSFKAIVYFYWRRPKLELAIFRKSLKILMVKSWKILSNLESKKLF